MISILHIMSDFQKWSNTREFIKNGLEDELQIQTKGRPGPRKIEKFRTNAN